MEKYQENEAIFNPRPVHNPSTSTPSSKYVIPMKRDERDAHSNGTAHAEARLGAGRSWGEEEIVAREVGYYSVYGELSDGEDSLEIREDRSQLRQITKICTPNNIVSIDKGLVPASPAAINEPQARPTVDKTMVCLNKWMRVHAHDLDKQELWREIDFVATNRVLSEILKIAYGKDFRTGTGWAFGAARVNGKIYVGNIIREGYDGMISGVILEMVEGTDTFRLQASNRNRQYEAMLCDGGVGNRSSFTKSLKPPGFHSVVHTKFRKISLLIVSTISAEDSNSRDFPGYPQKYVDLFNTPSKQFWRPQHDLRAFRMCRWWTMNALNGVGSVRVGSYEWKSDSETEVQKDVRAYRVADLPNIANDGRVCQYENCPNEDRMWKKDVCLTFLDQMLQKIRTKVILECTDAVYEFEGPVKPRDSSEDENNKYENMGPADRLRLITVHEIPVELARGHSYLPGP